eukprot:CAMPEP_0202973870 /NCGR_PEP_ID=MMETSP1396-20130829/54854_1 /ASSEMBLY_ACC=CAM_ASM_000872 /TAXON_ID= /ORGANISM="Pseudokeronopsis sp., Strain Brazil" /LENGTH=38 /DNA_ID= /DNA_START= /DNA_END= /DNA_ORIENTATION=
MVEQAKKLGVKMEFVRETVVDADLETGRAVTEKGKEYY